MTSLVDHHNMRAVITMVQLARVSKRPGTRQAALFDVGLHLQRLRDVEGRDKVAWIEIARRCGIGKNRAFVIMAAARKNLIAKSNTCPENHSKNSGPEGRTWGRKNQ